MKMRNLIKNVVIFALILLISPAMSSVYATPEDYIPPDVSIVMMTDYSQTLFGNEIHMSSDGSSVVATTGAEEVILYSIPDNFDGKSEIVWNLTSHTSVSAPGINSDGTKVSFIDSDDKSYYCYSDAGTDHLWAYDYSPHSVLNAKMSPDGSVLFLYYYDFIDITYYHIGLNGTNGNELWKNPALHLPTAIEFSNNGSVIALGYANGSFNCFNGYTGESLWQNEAGSSTVTSLDLSGDSSTLVTMVASGSDQDNVTVWNAVSGELYWSSLIESAGLGISITSTGDKIVIGSYTNLATNKKVRCYKRETKELLWEVSTTVQSRITDISADGRIAVAGIYDGMMLIIDAEVGSSIMEHNTYSSYINIALVSDDGRTAAASTPDGMLIIYKIGLDESVNSDGLINDLLDTVQNLDLSTYILLGGTAFVGLLLGGLLFGLGKKRK